MASHSGAQGQTRYVYDASGQRTIKINADGSSHIFSYNQQGQLLFEGRYNTAKQLQSQRHYIWLNNTPVGFVVKNNNSDNNNGDWNIYAIHTDHLNTPRLLTNQNGAEVWRWASDAFGESAAVGSIEFNLRFPGQYYDGESGLHYNYFRDYNTQTGRYTQSDPIGLQGGLNTYAYVNGNPMKFVDPTGELIWTAPFIALASFAIANYWGPNSLGNVISESNGNVRPGTKPQDGICSLGSVIGPLADKCVKDRCVKHDQCYEDNECNSSSWVSSALGGDKSCNQCNSGFFK